MIAPHVYGLAGALALAALGYAYTQHLRADLAAQEARSATARAEGLSDMVDAERAAREQAEQAMVQHRRALNRYRSGRERRDKAILGSDDPCRHGSLPPEIRAAFGGQP